MGALESKPLMLINFLVQTLGLYLQCTKIIILYENMKKKLPTVEHFWAIAYIFGAVLTGQSAKKQKGTSFICF